MGLSGQSVNINSNTSVSASLSSDLSKPGSTSTSNSTSVKITAAPSMSAASAVALQTGAGGSPDPGVSVPSPSASVSSASLPFSSAVPPPASLSTKADLPSSTNSTPGSPASVTTQTSVQHTSGGLGSTVVSVTVVRATAPGPETSTITTHPVSTLSKPMVLTTTDSNGSKLTMTPPLVTIWSTSTESDGSLVTTTSVVANVQQEQVVPNSGILHSPRAVAGIFSLVGVAFASFAICVVFCIRRHRRIRRRNKWLEGMRPQRPSSFSDDPFHDDNTLPTMRSVDSNTEDTYWDRKGTLASTIVGGSNHGHHNFGRANTAIIPDMYPIIRNGTFNQPERHQLQPKGIVSYTEPNRAQSRQSTPSVYPVSLPPEEDEHITEHVVPYRLNRSATTTTSLPPRPPRSHLRDRVKSLEHALPTPPESEASNQPSPISESRSYSAHVLNKKSILDVRSRPITS